MYNCYLYPHLKLYMNYFFFNLLISNIMIFLWSAYFYLNLSSIIWNDHLLLLISFFTFFILDHYLLLFHFFNVLFFSFFPLGLRALRLEERKNKHEKAARKHDMDEMYESIRIIKEMENEEKEVFFYAIFLDFFQTFILFCIFIKTILLQHGMV